MTSQPESAANRYAQALGRSGAVAEETQTRKKPITSLRIIVEQPKPPRRVRPRPRRLTVAQREDAAARAAAQAWIDTYGANL